MTMSWLSRWTGPKYRKPEGDWEQHACSLPQFDDLSQDALLSTKGNVWRCKCGRRWKRGEVLRVNGPGEGDYEYYLSWAELKSGLSDDDFKSLEALANGEGS